MEYERLYVLKSPSQPGYIKIGRTTRNVETRALELDSTGLALPLEPAYEATVSPDSGIVERRAHELLNSKRVRNSREWFECEAQEGIDALRTAISELENIRLVGEISFQSETTKTNDESRSPKIRFNTEKIPRIWSAPIEWPEVKVSA